MKVILLFISIILFVIIINYGDYLVKKNYIRECFVDNSNSNSNNCDIFNYNTIISVDDQYSSSVDMPINTTYSCKNFCGPQARCSLTGQQCTSDIDCYGCKNTKSKKGKVRTGKEILGWNEAGKLTNSFTPRYSVLTTDIGSKAKLYNEKNIKPPEYFKGVDQWKDSFNTGNELYDKRYNPSIGTLPFLPSYPTRYTLSGEFVDNGPLASNAYL